MKILKSILRTAFESTAHKTATPTVCPAALTIVQPAVHTAVTTVAQPAVLTVVCILAYAVAAIAVTFPAVTSAQAGQQIPDTLVLQSGDRQIKLSLTELKKKLPTVQVQVDDPVYSPPRKFDAFRLEDLLKLLGAAPTSADEVVFQAVDGYAPSISRAKLEGHAAFLAYQEHGWSKQKGAHGGKERFEKIRQGKAWISPAPFYLLWADGKKLGEEYPWPYQLVKIEFVSFREKYAKIYPQTAADSSEMRGFTTFKTDCIRCHSLNLVGGDIGPELNTPKNVLEYWDEKTLRAFIKDSSSFRARDKMPPFSNLTDANIDDIFSYFRYLKEHRSASAN
jgi:mono/diheme cytochrome c family protein